MLGIRLFVYFPRVQDKTCCHPGLTLFSRLGRFSPVLTRVVTLLRSLRISVDLCGSVVRIRFSVLGPFASIAPFAVKDFAFAVAFDLAEC